MHDIIEIKSNDIAVTGMYVKFPKAENGTQFWENIKSGKSCIGSFPKNRFKNIENMVHLQRNDINQSLLEGGYIEDIDLFDNELFSITPIEAKYMDPCQRFMLQAAYGAFEDAGVDFMNSKTGVFIGHSNDFGEEYKNLVRLYAEPTPASLTGNIKSLIAGRISYTFNLTGPSILIDTACSSYLTALHYACDSIKNNECDGAIVGSVNFIFAPFESISKSVGILSKENKTKTFDYYADGTAVGEGGGAVYIKPLQKAIEDNDRIYAVIKGSAVNQDGKSAGITAPNSESQRDVILNAWEEAEIEPESLSFIEAHGSGTQLGDPIEIEGLTQAFRAKTTKKQFCAISSVKTNIGHLDPAAGFAGLIKAIYAIYQREIPAGCNFTRPNRKINFINSPMYINDCHRSLDDNQKTMFCGISAFGLSGSNCHVVLQSFSEMPMSSDIYNDHLKLITVSAKSKETLFDYIKQYRLFIETVQESTLINVCYTANTARISYKHRAFFLFRTKEDLVSKLDSIIKANNIATNSIGDVYYNVLNDHILNPENHIDIKNRHTSSPQDKKWYDAAYLYINGYDVDWHELYGGSLHKTTIPIYPFKKNEFWIDANANNLKFANEHQTEKDSYELIWKKSNDNLQSRQKQKTQNICFYHQGTFTKSFLNDSKTKPKNIIFVELSDKYEKEDADLFKVGETYLDYEKVFNDVILTDPIRIMIFVDAFEALNNGDRLETFYDKVLSCLIHLVTFLRTHKLETEVFIITKDTHFINESDENANPYNMPIIDLGKVIDQENNYVHIKHIDMDNNFSFDELMKWMDSYPEFYYHAIRNKIFYTKHFQECEMKSIVPIKYRDGNVYIISGGTGGLGLEIAKGISNKCKANIYLFGKSKRNWMTGDTPKDVRIRNYIKQMEKSGSVVKVIFTDIVNIKKVELAIQDIRKKHKYISGVIHCAGINGKQIFNYESYREVITPKLFGALNLHEATKQDKLDFFAMFSSVASVFGFPGYGDYVAANSFLDSFSLYQRKMNIQSITVNWPAWEETGMAYDNQQNIDGAFKTIKTKDAVASFFKALDSGKANIIVGNINYKNSVFSGMYRFPFAISEKIRGKIEETYKEIEKSFNEKEIKIINNKKDLNQTEFKLAKIWGQVLDLNDVDMTVNFTDIGGNSILAGLLSRRIEKEFPGLTTVTDIFQYPSINLMAQFINRKIERLQKFDWITIPQKENNLDDIAIIGVACRFPEANNKEEYWENLKCGKISIINMPENRKESIKAYYADGIIPHRVAKFKAGFINEIDLFGAEFFKISPREAKLMDPVQRIFLEVAYRAIEDAGYRSEKLDGRNIGVFVGIDNANREYPNIIKHSEKEEYGLLKMTGMATGILASRISYLLNFRGPAISIDTSCSSGLVSLHQACMSLKVNDCEMALVGGINIMVFPSDSTAKLEIDAYHDMVRPFDNGADGTIWGEGAGVLLIKPLKKAINDGDSVYAVIKGSAINNDGYSNGITAPNPQAQSEVIIKAWYNAGINPESISYIESHGTGTKLGDPIEIQGLCHAFSQFTDKKQFCGLGSVKPNIGHGVASAGIASVIKMILSIQHKQIPPSLHFDYPNQHIDFQKSPIYMHNKLTGWDKTPICCGISSFGFSGTNCHLLLEEPPDTPIYDNEKTSYVFTLSSIDLDILYFQIDQYLNYLKHNRNTCLSQLCYTVNTGRSDYKFRLAILVGTVTELIQKLHCFIRIRKEKKEDGIYFGICEKTKIISTNQNQIIEAEEKATFLGDYHLLAAQYTAGYEINWDGLYNQRLEKLRGLPSYPFQRKSYWLQPVSGSIASSGISFLQPEWELIELQNQTLEHDLKRINIICIYTEDSKILDLSCEKIIQKDIFLGGKHNTASGVIYTENRRQEIFNALQQAGIDNNSKIIYISNSETQNCSDECLDQIREKVEGLLYLYQALSDLHITYGLEIIILQNHVQKVRNDECNRNYIGAALFGLSRSINAENVHIQCRCLDIENNTSSELIINRILYGGEHMTVIRGGQCFTESFKKYELKDLKQDVFELCKNDVYIILGGLGEVGLEIASYLSVNNQMKIVLMDKTSFPERDEWKKIIRENDNSYFTKIINKIHEIEQRGCKVQIDCCDISIPSSLEPSLLSVRRKFGKIDGIFHCAALSGKGFFVNKKTDEIIDSIKSQTVGTLLVDKYTQNDNLKCFILFSSIASYIGWAGQSDYAMASAFMDAFAYYRDNHKKCVKLINWPIWNIGMSRDYTLTDEEKIFKTLEVRDNIDIFDLLLHRMFLQLIPGILTSSGMLSNKENNVYEPIEETHRINETTKILNESNIQEKIAKIWMCVLELDKINLDENFNDLGGNSILATKLLTEINKSFPNKMDISDVYTYPTIRLMTNLLEQTDNENEITKKQDVIKDHDIMSVFDQLKNDNLSIEDALSILNER